MLKNMDYRQVFIPEIRWSYKTIAVLLFLAVMPNVLGYFSFSTPFGFNIHLFQYLIFLAALLYGPAGGGISGAAGSIYPAFALHNPYIIIGNMILGIFVGLFSKKTSIFLAVLAAYAIQLPFLWITDVYLAGMPVNIVQVVVFVLLIENILSAAAAKLTYKKAKELIA